MKIKNEKIYLWCGCLAIGLVISIIMATAMGSTSIEPKAVYGVIGYEVFKMKGFYELSSGPIHDVVWLIRLPRVLLAIAVGGGLAVCGLVMQAVVKNPLADPYLLGVSSGASLGATLAILMGVGLFLGENYVGIVACIGAILATLLVMIIANTGMRADAVRLLLAGMAVNAILSSFASFIVFFANDKEGIQNITFWLMGSLAGAKWKTLAYVHGIVGIGSLLLWSQFRTLNLMLLGDEVSITLGTSLQKWRQLYMVMTAIMIGFVVFASGMIGFVGLIVPHVARLLVGSDHRKNLPLSFLIGAIFMIWADVFSRTIIPHTELPIGILISMIGAPCFVYMLIKSQYAFGGR